MKKRYQTHELLLFAAQADTEATREHWAARARVQAFQNLWRAS